MSMCFSTKFVFHKVCLPLKFVSPQSLGATTDPFLAAVAVLSDFFGWELTLLASLSSSESGSSLLSELELSLDSAFFAVTTGPVPVPFFEADIACFFVGRAALEKGSS